MFTSKPDPNRAVARLNVPTHSHASDSSAKLPNLSFESGHLNEKTYWVGLRIPWSDAGQVYKPGMRLGFDVGVDGPNPGPTGRKTQMVMFGTDVNYIEASEFGIGIIGDLPPNS